MAANHDDETRDRMLKRAAGQFEMRITEEMGEHLREHLGYDPGAGESWSAASWSNDSTTTVFKLPGELNLKLSRDLMRRYADDLSILADRMDENGDEAAAKEIRESIQAAKQDVVDYLHRQMKAAKDVLGANDVLGGRTVYYDHLD